MTDHAQDHAGARQPDREAFEPLPRSSLRGFERLSVRLCDAINTWRWLKRLVQLYVRYCPRSFVRWICSNRYEVYGLDRVQDLQPPRGVILVSNHRSFFDMYTGSCLLYNRASFMDCLYFPVRAPFFYTNPLGLCLNFMMSGCAMWPPIFRDDRKAALNAISFSQMVFALSNPGGILGIHPEGTRNKGDDPYALLAGKPGLARLVGACHPDTLVLPFFIIGISNSLATEVIRKLFPGSRKEPIRVYFGAPISCGELQGHAESAQVTDQVMKVLGDLGHQDRVRMGLADDDASMPTDEAAAMASNGTNG